MPTFPRSWWVPLLITLWCIWNALRIIRIISKVLKATYRAPQGLASDLFSTCLSHPPPAYSLLQLYSKCLVPPPHHGSPIREEYLLSHFPLTRTPPPSFLISSYSFFRLQCKLHSLGKNVYDPTDSITFHHPYYKLLWLHGLSFTAFIKFAIIMLMCIFT